MSDTRPPSSLAVVVSSAHPTNAIISCRISRILEASRSSSSHCASIVRRLLVDGRMRKEQLGNQLFSSRCALALELLNLLRLERLSGRVIDNLAIRSDENLAGLIDESKLLSICGSNHFVTLCWFCRFGAGVGQVVGIELFGRDYAKSRKRLALALVLNLVCEVVRAVDDEI
ncbi:hypothetical protein HG530_011282 [Fusarium avenaceum]|nr:hypothetical protein HG530_011282 [Fusarium avenaceum]